MTSIIERYWQHVFKDYQVGPRKFEIESFPDPLMSADFESQNLVAKQAQGVSFRLGVSQTSASKIQTHYGLMSLAHAAKTGWYEDLLMEGFPNETAFLTKLTDFLITTNATYLNINLGENPFAMTNIAVAGDIALIFNGVVASSKRGQGLAGVLHHIANYEAYKHGAKELFFWTKHEGLLRYSERSAFYNIKTTV